MRVKKVVRGLSSLERGRTTSYDRGAHSPASAETADTACRMSVASLLTGSRNQRRLDKPQPRNSCCWRLIFRRIWCGSLQPCADENRLNCHPRSSKQTAAWSSSRRSLWRFAAVFMPIRSSAAPNTARLPSWAKSWPRRESCISRGRMAAGSSQLFRERRLPGRQ